ncbi:MAG: hypothetical protein N2560_08660 [Ignavibacteria bacterium]|nr:hypothetical protein [Ignavibacteria bacterium]
MQAIYFAFIFVFLLTFPTKIFARDLLAHWSFDDGTARDVTGNGYDGVLVNNPTIVPGVSGNAMHFQGKGNYIPVNGDVKEIGSHILLPPINLHGLNEFTITMWVYEEGFSYSYGEFYFWFGHFERGWLGIGNHYQQYNDKFFLIIQFATNGKGFSNVIEKTFSNNFRNTWVCYSMVYDKGKLTAYVNGNNIGTKQTNINYILDNFALCRHWWFYDGEERTSSRFTGAIDEVKIYLRALSEEEIASECNSCGPMSFAYDKFYSTPKLHLINHASLVGEFIRLTHSSNNQTGAVWTSHLVPVGQGFETTFKFRITNGVNPNHSEEHYPGADGIAFVIQNTSPNALGTLGGGLGYDGIANSLAIEFDTYSNDSTQIENFNDPNDNHIAVLSNGRGTNSSKHKAPYLLAQTTSIIPINTDGTIYYGKVEYEKDKGRIKVWLDTSGNFLSPVLEVERIDLTNLLSLDQWEGAYIGFTSATGNAYENHDLLAWSFCARSRKLYASMEEAQREKYMLTMSEKKNVIIKSDKVQEVYVECYNILGEICFIKPITLSIGTNIIDIDEEIKGLNTGLFFLIIKSSEMIILKNLFYY